MARLPRVPYETELLRLRYTEHLPAAGEIVLLDRSWYDRAGVERAMGFCTPDEYARFLRQCPVFEELLVEDGVLLRTYWSSVSDAEQECRFRGRMTDRSAAGRTTRARRTRCSPRAVTSTSPWFVVEAEDKRRARMNMIAHLLDSVPWEPTKGRTLTLPNARPSAATCGRRANASTRCPTTRRCSADGTGAFPDIAPAVGPFEEALVAEGTPSRASAGTGPTARARVIVVQRQYWFTAPARDGSAGESLR